MVTLKEYIDALEKPIVIPLRELNPVVFYTGLAHVDRSNRAQLSLLQESAIIRRANKVVALAFVRWLNAHGIPPPGFFSSPENYNLIGAGCPVIHERRIAIIASIAMRKDLHRMSIHSFGMRIPIGWLHSTCNSADYYVYCVVDPDLRLASLIGYYEGYALSGYVARIGAVRQCLALPVSRLHPMRDLSLILKNGLVSSTSLDVQVY